MESRFFVAIAAVVIFVAFGVVLFYGTLVAARMMGIPI